jgi:hypothetical protein
MPSFYFVHVILSVVLLSVIMLKAIVLSVFTGSGVKLNVIIPIVKMTIVVQVFQLLRRMARIKLS